MDNFLQIDWNPPLEDIVDTKFVDTERIKRESVIYRMLKGKFNNPFVDIQMGQEHLVTSEIMAQVAFENKEQEQPAESKSIAAVKAESNEEITVTHRDAYIPGLVTNRVWFPKKSNLNATQQALCLRVLLKFNGSERPEITATDKKELQTYMSLMPTILQEQQEFLEFAKKNWDPSRFTIHEEAFINEQWKKKIKRVNSLPKYYSEAGNIPFVSPKEIGLNFHSSCLEMGILPNSVLPLLNRRLILTSPTTKINQRFFSAETNTGSQKSVIFKTTVSQDPNCDILVKNHEVDLVISSSGLNCLALNIDTENTTSWILPVVVKRINERNVVYVDKPLPPTGLTVIQKNAWIYKYKLKSFVNQPYHSKAISLDEETDKEVARLRISRNFDAVDAAKRLKMSNEVIDKTREDNIDGADESKNSSQFKDQNDGFFRPPIGHNLFYRLFSVGSCGEHQSELLKNRTEKTYKLLVRTKGDGAMRKPNGDRHLMLIAPKLEHQLNFGAEAVTVEEAAKQWMSLTFRPDTSLARIRIDSTTSEVIQIETRTPISINNEIKRLYKLKPETALTLLYNVAETMTSMLPGRYLIRHSMRSGAFANIYKEVKGPGRNVFDLETVYWEEEFRTIPNATWPAIDKDVVTPTIKYFNRMPAMYRGRRVTNVGNKKKRGERNKKKNTNVNGVRKSLRKKEDQ